jgi:hypothetical protein
MVRNAPAQAKSAAQRVMTKAKDLTERTGGVTGLAAAAVGGAAGVVAGVVESFRGPGNADNATASAGGDMTQRADSPMSGGGDGGSGAGNAQDDDEEDDFGASVADDDDDPTGM